MEIKTLRLMNNLRLVSEILVLFQSDQPLKI